MTRIILVEDHKIVRQGMKLMFDQEPGFEVIADFDNGEAFSGYMYRMPKEDLRPFVLILDISLPGKSGFEILRMMKSQHPKIPVLVLSMHPEELMAVRSLRAGASGYLNKDAEPEVLKTATKLIGTGGKHISSSVSHQLVNQLRGNADKLPHEKLSEREFEVFLLLGAGLSNKEISEHLSLSSKTVSTYKMRILDKLELAGIGDLVKYMLTHSLSDLKP